MNPEIRTPTINEHGEEAHPAFGLIGAHRVSTSPLGAVPFDGDMRYSHSVVVSIESGRDETSLGSVSMALRTGPVVIQVTDEQARGIMERHVGRCFPARVVYSARCPRFPIKP